MNPATSTRLDKIGTTLANLHRRVNDMTPKEERLQHIERDLKALALRIESLEAISFQLKK